MARYMFELECEIESCTACPCFEKDYTTHGRAYCNLKEGLIPVTWEAGEFSPYEMAHYERPGWCPLEPVEGALCVNESCECCDERETCSGVLRVVR